MPIGKTVKFNMFLTTYFERLLIFKLFGEKNVKYQNVLRAEINIPFSHGETVQKQ